MTDDFYLLSLLNHKSSGSPIGRPERNGALTLWNSPVDGTKWRAPSTGLPPIARSPQTSDNAALLGKLVSEPVPIFDLVIAGAGVSGLALAAAVKQAMGSGASIALVDPAP